MTPRFSIIPARIVDDRRLDARAVVVLALLGTYTDRNGWCFPSQATLAERMGVSRQAIAQQINVLVKYGYIEKKNRKRENGSVTSSLYRVIFEDKDAELPDFDDPEQVVLIEKASGPVEEKPKVNHFDMAKVLSEVCGMDFNLNKPRMFTFAKTLNTAGYTLEDILRIYAKPDGVWYHEDFRGKKGEYPNQSTIMSTIQQLKSVGVVVQIVSGDVSKGYIDG
jgi:hypothetical protein